MPTINKISRISKPLVKTRWLVTRAQVLSLGLPHGGGAEVQPQTYIVEHEEKPQ